MTAIQDLICLDNGLLLSCAYDGRIICWNYRYDVAYIPIVKENQQLRCMGAVTDSGMLLVGTNNFAILTQQITDWCNYENDDISSYQGEHAMIGMDYGSEESKEDSEDRYDVLEGRTLDENFQDALDGTAAMTLDQIKRQQAAIMARDRGAR